MITTLDAGGGRGGEGEGGRRRRGGGGRIYDYGRPAHRSITPQEQSFDREAKNGSGLDPISVFHHREVTRRRRRCR